MPDTNQTIEIARVLLRWLEDERSTIEASTVFLTLADFCQRHGATDKSAVAAVLLLVDSGILKRVERIADVLADSGKRQGRRFVLSDGRAKARHWTVRGASEVLHVTRAELAVANERLQAWRTKTKEREQKGSKGQRSTADLRPVQVMWLTELEPAMRTVPRSLLRRLTSLRAIRKKRSSRGWSVSSELPTPLAEIKKLWPDHWRDRAISYLEQFNWEQKSAQSLYVLRRLPDELSAAIAARPAASDLLELAVACVVALCPEFEVQSAQPARVKAYQSDLKRVEQLNERLLILDRLAIGTRARSMDERAPIPRDIQKEVWQRDEGRCVGCGSNLKLCFDHIIPLSRGGSNSARNLQLLCEVCNLKKGNRI